MNKKIKSLLLSMCFVFSLTGCGSMEPVQEEPTQISEYEFDITEQTSEFGIQATDADILSKLQNNTYYVLHDGVYYPLYVWEYSSLMTETLTHEDAPDYSRKLYYTTSTEHNIPTFYEGDKIIYYSTNSLLDVITWERFYDLKYTIGVTNLHKMTTDRYYINLEDSEYPILADTELQNILTINTDAQNILFDKIGDVPITTDLIQDGFIYNLTKDQYYDVDVYNGTYYNKYTTKANYHVFRSYELFASTDYITKRAYIYEIEVPDYFVNGYYYLNNAGLFRYVKGNTYNSDTDFNQQLLYPIYTEEEIVEGIFKIPACYSENPQINYFRSDTEGTLGYVDPSIVEEYLPDASDPNTPSRIKKSVIKTFDIWLPKNEVCEISIISNSGEQTGSITVETGDVLKTSNYDYINNKYNLSINGKGEKATLTISGFYDGYELSLKTAEIYDEQDIKGDHITNPELYLNTLDTTSENNSDIVENTNSEIILDQTNEINDNLNENDNTLVTDNDVLTSLISAYKTFGIIISGISFLISLFSIICLWKIYTKAGERGFKSIIPIYNMYIFYKIIFKNGWLFLLTIIPAVGSIFSLVAMYKLAKVFGKSTPFAICNIFFSFITLPILAFGACEYEE